MVIDNSSDIELIDNTFDLLDKMEGGSSKSTKQDLAPNDDHEEEEHDEENDDIIVDPLESKAKSQTVNEDDNKTPLAILQEQWISDGRLPKDYVITDDEEKLDAAVYDHKVKLLLDEKFNEHIQKNGLTDTEIAQLRGQNLGIDVIQYNKARAYSDLSKIEFDENTDDYSSQVKELLKIYYTDLKMPSNKIERTIESDLDSDDIDDTINEARQHFASQAVSVNKQIKESEEKAAKDREEKSKAAIEKEKTLLRSKIIGGRKFSEEEVKYFEKALYEKTEVLTKKDGQGIKATAYEKKIAEITSNEEKAFLSKLLFLLEDFNGDTPQEKASKSILKQLNNATHSLRHKQNANITELI